jgi:uncharacterized repeat protein (TIGR03803 family)
VNFNGTNGRTPQAQLLAGADGILYGTTSGGGPSGAAGTVFKLTLDGTLTTLASFYVTNGASPAAALVQGEDGNFYGTTAIGGAYPGPNGYGCGTIFRVTPGGAITSLASFDGANDYWPPSALLPDGHGNFLGAAREGGPYTFWTGYSEGAIFRITPDGLLTNWIYFNGTNGAFPWGALVKGRDGNFYGTTGAGGGPDGQASGTIFRLTGDGTLTTLVVFNDTNGYNPQYGLVASGDGGFYGVTAGGGLHDVYGTIFKFTEQGQFTSLFWFQATNGSLPRLLTVGSDGNIYGSAGSGGIGGGGYSYNGNGTVFQMTPKGKLTTLVWFNGTNGWHPFGGLVQGADGSFYGTTQDGGASSNGTLFRVSVPSAATPKIQIVTRSGDTLTLNWIALAGGSYQLQFKSALDQASWSNLGSPFLTSSSLGATSDSISSEPCRFYRVALLP